MGRRSNFSSRASCRMVQFATAGDLCSAQRYFSLPYRRCALLIRSVIMMIYCSCVAFSQTIPSPGSGNDRSGDSADYLEDAVSTYWPELNATERAAKVNEKTSLINSAVSDLKLILNASDIIDGVPSIDVVDTIVEYIGPDRDLLELFPAIPKLLDTACDWEIYILKPDYEDNVASGPQTTNLLRLSMPLVCGHEGGGGYFTSVLGHEIRHNIDKRLVRADDAVTREKKRLSSELRAIRFQIILARVAGGLTNTAGPSIGPLFSSRFVEGMLQAAEASADRYIIRANADKTKYPGSLSCWITFERNLEELRDRAHELQQQLP